MLDFALNAMDDPDPFNVVTEIPESVKKAILWSAERTSDMVIAEREAII